MLRRVSSALVVLACAGVMIGCSAPPAPPPTPTALSEAEAFAAAEATYRAYVDAGNAERAGRHTAERPLSFLVGKAISDELAGERYFEDRDLTPEGDIEMADFEGVDLDGLRVFARACLDVSETRVLNSDGTVVTPASRPDRQSLDLEFTFIGGELLLTNSMAGAEKC